MAQVDTAVGSAPAEAPGDSNYLTALQADADASFAALEEPTQPSAEATADAPAELLVTGTAAITSDADPGSTISAPESVDAELAGNDDEVITRRNARELVEKARAAEREAIEKAAKAEQDAKQLQETHAQHQARLDALANTWGKAGDYARQLTEAIAEEDWTAIDEVAAKFGVESPSALDARGLLKQLKEQHQRNGEMGDFWRQAFIANTGATWAKIAEREGIDREIVMGADMGKALDHIYDAGVKSMQGKIDALEAENKALRAKAGALSPSPESGGQGATNGSVPRTVQELERMGLADFEKQFDKILASIPNR